MQRPDSCVGTLGVKTVTSIPQEALCIMTLAPEGNITWRKVSHDKKTET